MGWLILLVILLLPLMFIIEFIEHNVKYMFKSPEEIEKEREDDYWAGKGM